MMIKYSIYAICFFFLSLILGCQSSDNHIAMLEEDPLAYVDPMIGTGGHGHTFPGATVPFGLVQLSPSNDYKGWDWSAGYHYSDSTIKGFAHNHMSGPGLVGLGDILVMPARNAHLRAGTESNPELGFRARFSRQDETARAGYYRVLFPEESITAELTASPRMGYHKYTFYGDAPAFIIFDPTHGLNENIYEVHVEKISETEIQGYKYNSGWSAGERTMFFYAQFSKPIQTFQLSTNETILPDESATGTDILAQVGFHINSGDSILVRLALSAGSLEGARNNFDEEAVSSFAEAHQNARKAWQQVMAKIQLGGATEKQKRIYYTGMYHAFISPNLISDADGKYVVEGQVHESEMLQYSNYSTWDTYRALHPLFTIIDKKKTAAFTNSLSSRVTDTQVGLPSWECHGYDNRCMIGYSAVSPIADAVLKDVPGVNVDAAYQAIRFAAFDSSKHSAVSDRNGMDEYIKYGYVTAETGVSVSKTTEQAYCDWAIARVAEKLGKTADAALFDSRSLGYRHLFHPLSGYFMPISQTGDMMVLDTSTWNGMQRHYISGNVWAYSAYTPHDMKGMIQLHGGTEAYANWLANIFNNTTEVGGGQHVDISGFIGKYGHGDESGHHMPYLFNYVGKPWLTQQYVREVMTTMYQDTPEEGFINNEDLGQMSAWYLLSALGLYQVAPGDGAFQLGAPLHPKAVIHLEDGKQITILAKGVSDKNKYVQSVSWNGSPHFDNYIRYKQLMAGGTLTFVMGSEPNKAWGSRPEHTLLGAFDDSAKPDVPVIGTPAPIDETAGAFFAGQRQIRLISARPNTQIYYTLDGSVPDERSLPFKESIVIRNDVTLKAIGLADGLNPSGIYEKSYFESLFAKLEPGFPKYMVTQKDFPYGEPEVQLLFDEVVGSRNYSDHKWTGIKDNLNVLVDLGSSQPVKTAVEGVLWDTNSWIFPPQRIVVRAG
ncbi:MAG: glycoside hydrolase family 92 protein, partial [Saprospiraceae bacterium]|nr:glycoside hydrolase family 92 protein [Saprospiraceae bacterium]